MGLGILPLEIKILLESNPLKSRILVRRLAVGFIALEVRLQGRGMRARIRTRTHDLGLVVCTDLGARYRYTCDHYCTCAAQ